MTCTFCKKAPGTHRLTARIWAKGHPRTPGTSALMELLEPDTKIVGSVCEPCGLATIAAGTKVYFEPGGETIRKLFRAQGKLEPDLDGAELSITPIAAEATGRPQ